MDVAATWLLLAGPLAGAAVLALPPIARAGRGRWEPIALGAIAAAAIGLACAAAAWPVLGRADRYVVSLGPLDPGDPLAGVAWSAAPTALACLFLALARRARSRTLESLAAGQLVVAALATAVEWTARHEAAGVAGALVVDPLAFTLLAVSVGVGGLIAIYGLGYEPAHLAEHHLDPRRTPLFLAWLLAFIAAMNLFVLADDLRVLVTAWEVTTLCSVVLIGFDGDPSAIRASRTALGYGLFGAIALAVGALLAGPGARVSDLLAGRGTSDGALPLILAACIVAAATKSALVPFHPWLLGAMVAAAPVSALLHASAMVKAGSYLLLRLSPSIATDGLLGPALVGLGAFTFASTALEALRQRDLKRILALSTISTLGLIAVAAGLGSPAALAAGLLLLVFHAVAKALAFLSVGAIEQVTRTRDLEALVGGARTMPRLAGPLVVAAIALALPPFGLVVAKWAILEVGAPDVPLVVLLAAGGAAYLAVWTAVIGRLIAHRTDRLGAAAGGRTLPRLEALPIAALVVISAAGLVLAAPVARAFADPAGRIAFGIDPALGAGWSVALGSGAFLVPAVAALGVAATILALVAMARIHHVAPAPYLSGAGIQRGPLGGFHAPHGSTAMARGGGFYWGVEAGRPADPAGGARSAATSRVLLVVGWLLVLAIAAAGIAGAIGVGAAR